MAKVMVLGEKFERTVEQENFTKLNKRLEAIRIKHVKKFREKYDFFCASRYPHNYMRISLKDVIKEVIEILNDNNIYSISEEGFTDKYLDLSGINAVCDKVQGNIESIKNAGEEEKLYRELRKANRTQYAGAGIGFENALKASIEAKTINAATGMAHSVFNAIGNMGTDRRTEKALSAAYRDGNTPILMEKALNACIESLIYPLVKILKYEVDIECEIISEADKEKATTILASIKDGKVPEAKIEEQLKKAWELNPHNQNLYEMMININDDEDGSIEKLAHHFGIEISEYKEKIVRDGLSHYIHKNLLRLEDKERLLKSKEYVLKECKRLNIRIEKLKKSSELRKVYDSFEEKLNTIDIAERTVEGVVYDAKEVTNVQDDLEVFYSHIIGKDLIEKNNYEVVKEELLKVQFKSQEFKKTLISRLESLHIERDESTFRERALKMIRKSSIYNADFKENMFLEVSSKSEKDTIISNHRGLIKQDVLNEEKIFFYYYNRGEGILITRMKVYFINTEKVYSVFWQKSSYTVTPLILKNICTESQRKELNRIVQEIVRMVRVINENYPKTKFGVFSEEEVNAIREDLSSKIGDLNELSSEELDRLASDLDKEYSSTIIEPIISKITAIKEDREFHELCLNIENISKDQLKKLQKILNKSYSKIPTKKEITSRINKRFNEIYKDELDTICADLEKKNFYELEKIAAQVEKNKSNPKIKAEYISRIEDYKQEKYKELHKGLIDSVDELLNQHRLKSFCFGSAKDANIAALMEVWDGVMTQLIEKWEVPLVIYFILRGDKFKGIYALMPDRFMVVVGDSLYRIAWKDVSKFVYIKKMFSTEMQVEYTDGTILPIPNEHGKDTIKYVDVLNQILAMVKGKK